MLKTKEAASYFGVTKATLESWRCHGGGPVFYKLGKAVRYRKEDLDAFINARRRTSTSQNPAAQNGKTQTQTERNPTS